MLTNSLKISEYLAKNQLNASKKYSKKPKRLKYFYKNRFILEYFSNYISQKSTFFKHEL